MAKGKIRYIEVNGHNFKVYNDYTQKATFASDGYITRQISDGGYTNDDAKATAEIKKDFFLENGKRKLTFAEVSDRFWELNADGDYTHEDCAVMVVSADNFKPEYQNCSLEARSYWFSCNNRTFQHNKIANSLFMHCLDGSEHNVRYDWYSWKIEYCYLLEPDEIPKQ